MFGIVAALVAGMLFGLCPGTGRYKRLMKTLGMVGLFSLLLTMGIEVGGDEQVMTGIGRLGLSALLLALFTVAGSLVFILPIAPLLGSRKYLEVADD